MNDTRITTEMRDRFVRNGLVVLRGALPDRLLEDARRAVEATVPEDLTDTEALVAGPEDRHYWNDLDDMRPFAPINERLYEHASALVGGDTLASPTEFTQVALRYPTGETAAHSDHPTTPDDGNPHVDIVQEDGLNPFTVGATAYLDDVYPREGGLTVWPGTHRRVAAHLDETDGNTLDGERVRALENDTITDAALGDDTVPFEVTGSAGTVVLWHSLLVHTGGVNLGARPRVASFARFDHREREAV